MMGVSPHSTQWANRGVSLHSAQWDNRGVSLHSSDNDYKRPQRPFKNDIFFLILFFCM